MDYKEVKPTAEFLGALLMCLQKALFEQCDINDIFKSLKFVVSEDQLFILNPPVVHVPEEIASILEKK